MEYRRTLIAFGLEPNDVTRANLKREFQASIDRCPGIQRIVNLDSLFTHASQRNDKWIIKNGCSIKNSCSIKYT